MPFGIDIKEEEIRSWGYDILDYLLKDQTTGENIIWATDDYASRGEGYSFFDPITIERITGDNARIIQPRIAKSQEEQRRRSINKAEVFTPSWICNAQNNMIDKAWFETEQDIFNHELCVDGQHSWIPTVSLPPYPKGKNWQAYVKDVRLEMACGEAPYLCSRYDTTTGELIPIERRIGLLDRKLALIHIHTPNVTPDMNRQQRRAVHKKWRCKAYQAMQSVYAFEWQGDNLLLARESALITFIEYYQAKWKTNKLPPKEFLKKMAEIISWNFWQMDGTKYGIPGYNPLSDGLFAVVASPRERFCHIKEWTDTTPLKGREIPFTELLNPNT